MLTHHLESLQAAVQRGELQEGPLEAAELAAPRTKKDRVRRTKHKRGKCSPKNSALRRSTPSPTSTECLSVHEWKSAGTILGPVPRARLEIPRRHRALGRTHRGLASIGKATLSDPE